MQKNFTEGALSTLKAAARDVEGSLTAYSGRNMYGGECLGITTLDAPKLFGEILSHLGQLADKGDTSVKGQIDEFELFFRACRTDSLGEGVVLYNTAFAVPEGVTEGVA
jgi:hypothetical protein